MAFVAAINDAPYAFLVCNGADSVSEDVRCGLEALAPDDMRDLAERSVEQARRAFEGFLGAAEQTVASFERRSESLQTASRDVTRRAFAYAGDNIGAAFDLAQKLARARDYEEVVRLQMEFLRLQMASFQGQIASLTSDKSPVGEG
jgi:phasin